MKKSFKLFKWISSRSKVRKAKKYNRDIERRIEQVFKGSGIKIEKRKPVKEKEKVYYVSFHNKKRNTPNKTQKS